MTNLGTLALAEMHARDQRLGIDPRSPSPVVVVGEQPATLPAGLVIERVDWHEENRLRQQAELERQRQERELILQEELARLEPAQAPGKPTPPAQRKRWRVA